MSTPPPIRYSLRARLFVAQLLVIVVGIATLSLAAWIIASGLHDHLMVAVFTPKAATLFGGDMTEMERATNAVFRTAMLQALLWSAGAALLTALAISLFVSARVVTPLRRLLTASRRVAAGHYADRVPVDTSDEVGALAAQFNLMAEALETVEQRRVALIGDVAHELRTPLATIEGYTEGLLDGVVEASPETWALLYDEVGRLRRLVADLQELSRAEARQIPLHLVPIAPAQLVEQALARMAAQFADKQITLVHAVASDLPLVRADGDRIIQVLVNLLGNALRYTPSGGSVRVSAERTHAHVIFHIADTGSGIAPEHLPHLFERFYRVDKARARAGGGSGIGLTIAQALVEAHGGSIWATSLGSDHGSTFSFTLPTRS